MTASGLPTLPGPLQERIEAVLADAPQLDCAALPQALADSLAYVWSCSEFVLEWCRKDIPRFMALADAAFFTCPTLQTNTAPELSAADTTAEAMRRLRRWRNEHLVRIAWRDLAGWNDLGETLAELSGLADTCLATALDWLSAHAPTGVPPLIVIGMGKLGGQELNFSSDIDLIFAYRESSAEQESGVDQKAVRRLAQQLVKMLSEVTEDGFVFRVDTRLRPFGDAGPLVVSGDAMESYYQAHGREWERYAWIKARPVAGDIDGGQALIKRLQPFVYRRYLDYNAFESIRDMKALIEEQVTRRGQEDNIKVGRGGIREIEFIAQGFQLIRGGQEPALQGNRLLPVLRSLTEAGHLPAHAAHALEQAYVFLRRVENRLQMRDDRQTHDLPDEDGARQVLALAMGCEDWPAFSAVLEEHRRNVDEHFQQVFAAPQIDDGTGQEEQALLSAWQEGAQATQAEQALAGYGLREPAAVWQRLLALREGMMYRTLGDRGRRRLQQLLPMLLQVVAQRQSPDDALIRVVGVLEQIVGRTTYVALLVENPAALSRLVDLCGASPWISRQIEDQPMLLDTLLDSRLLFSPPDYAQLQTELTDALVEVPASDLESRMDLLRRFQQQAMLRVAAADVSKSMPLMVVSDRLTELAEVVLAAALDMAWSQIVARYGRPVIRGGERDDRCAEFAVIGYGKFGGLELGYGSDLDLVFLYDSPAEQSTDGERSLSHEAFFLRLAQRLIHVLSTQTGGGRAYEVDMRLRPSGQAGLLVSHIDAYAAYQRDKAWTWEHQALVRARPVAGDRALAERFRTLRETVLACGRDESDLRADVTKMRRKMRDNLERHGDGELDLKQTPGGLIDIEFLAQYAVLQYACECPELLLFTDTIRILETLESAQLMDYATTRQLTQAYRGYRMQVHADALQQTRAMIGADGFVEERSAVGAIWHDWLG